MRKTQKRAHTVGIEKAGMAFGSRDAAAARTGAGDREAGAGEGVRGEQGLPRDAAAGYVHEMAIELKNIAKLARFSFLAYLLDLVIEESSMRKRGRL